MQQRCRKGWICFNKNILIYNLSIVQPPARLPIEDFPVRRPELGPGLTCQNSIACTLFDDCDEVISLQVILLGQGDYIVTPPSKSLCVRTKVRVELATISLKTTSPCVKLGGGRVAQGDRLASIIRRKTPIHPLRLFLWH